MAVEFKGIILNTENMTMEELKDLQKEVRNLREHVSMQIKMREMAKRHHGHVEDPR